MTQHKRPTQKHRVLRLLEDAGARGVRTNEFLAHHLPRFGARIYELRNEGYQITGTPDAKSESGIVYVLVGRDPDWPLHPRAKRRRTADRIEDRVLSLAERFEEGTRLAITMRTEPATPATRWTISAVAPQNVYPGPGRAWIGETLDEALTQAETAQRAKQ